MTNDLISRSALLAKAIEEKRFVFRMEDLLREEEVFQTVYKDLASFILSAPAVDAVEVCRCKACKRNNEEKALRKGGIWCEYWGIDPSPDDFCKRGERRSNNAD